MINSLNFSNNLKNTLVGEKQLKKINYKSNLLTSNNTVSFSSVRIKRFGELLAKSAELVAKELNSKGYCKKGVRLALEKHGMTLKGISAYMSAEQLAINPKFKEIIVKRWGLKKLKPGSIVVWDKCIGHQHGHISVALGKGREASDCIRKQFVFYGPRYRVFEPIDNVLIA